MGVHLLCLAPLIWVVRFCISPRVFLNPDPVKFIINFTGNWGMCLLLVCICLLVLGELIGKGLGTKALEGAEIAGIEDPPSCLALGAELLDEHVGAAVEP